MVSIDCTEAFALVSHPALRDELRRHKTSPWIYNIISSCLEKRKASFRVINTIAKPKPLYLGVPQGAVFSPLLFNNYVTVKTAHLLKTFRPNVSVAAYADDITFYSSHSNPNTAVQNIETTLNHLTDELPRQTALFSVAIPNTNDLHIFDSDIK